MKWVESVPNFSVGRDSAAVASIASALDSVTGAHLLHVDPEDDTNRCVMTLIGEPEAVGEAVFRAVREAMQCIDMNRHTGTHPRMGATDVLPFVPWSGISVAECVELAHDIGVRIGEELALPGWFYGDAREADSNRYLHDIRRGQFERLAGKFERKVVDFGPQEPHPTAGAIAVGVRPILVAMNCTLDSRDVAEAQCIASQLREFQHVRRSANGEIVQRVSAGMPGLRALGWFSERDGFSQVTMNVTDIVQSPPYRVFARLLELVEQRGGRVLGTELVGMIPEKLVLEAGLHVDSNSVNPLSEGIRFLRLGAMHPFEAEQRIIECCLDARGILG